MPDRNLIVSEARSWIGTRFHHQGRIKKNNYNKGGCDCIGLVVGVADALDIRCDGVKLSRYDRTDYARIPDGNQLKEAFCQYLDEIAPSDIAAGDILMFRFDKEPQHVGIVSENANNLNIIHCYLQARGVVEHSLDNAWISRIIAAFSFKG